MEVSSIPVTKHRKKQTPTIRYEPYPTIVVKPKKIKKKQLQPPDDVEEGEITEVKEESNNLGTIDPITTHNVQGAFPVNQITAINELCSRFCTTGTRRTRTLNPTASGYATDVLQVRASQLVPESTILPR